jgi:hypothetical protein
LGHLQYERSRKPVVSCCQINQAIAAAAQRGAGAGTVQTAEALLAPARQVV